MSFEVMARPCDQCLMTPQRIVSGARAAQLLKECKRKDSSFLCHKGTIEERQIACRSHFDTGVGQMSRIAERMGMIVEIDPETLRPVGAEPETETTEMPPHPKPTAKPKSPRAMKSKPKTTKEVLTAATEVLKADKAAKAPKPKKAAAKPAAPAGGSKTALLMGMLTKPGGASSKEMEAATGWAPHSVRGFLGTLRKKGVNVVAKKFGKGEPTVYSIEASEPIPAPPPQPDATPAEDPGEVV